MKILIISTTKFDLNGITNVIMNYYHAFDKSDMQIEFVVPNKVNDKLKNEIETNNSKIYELFMRNQNLFKYVKKLSQIIKNGNYDIVHANGNSCTLALEMYTAKKGGAKVRISHSHNTTCEHMILHRVLRRLFDNNYTNAFACGDKAGEWLYNGKPFTIINNGIDIERFSYKYFIREEYRQKYKLQGKKVIGNIGHFSYQKNHELLIKIFNELYKLDANYKLLLVGDGKLRKDLENQVNNLGLNDAVIFTGKSLEVGKLLQAMDMVVMPSRFEGLPLTLVEAQAACLPCFVSDKVTKEAAITDLVKFIPFEKSPKEWAEQINNSITKNREEIKESIYKQIVNAGYSITDNAIILKDLYKKFIKQV